MMQLQSVQRYKAAFKELSTLKTDFKALQDLSLKQSAGPKIESAMIEKDKQELERIKMKQQKDFEQMMEMERKNEEIRMKNA